MALWEKVLAAKPEDFNPWISQDRRREETSVSCLLTYRVRGQGERKREKGR